MDVRKVDYYGACDKAIQSMNRYNLDAFGRLKMAKWDDINVIQTVVKVYRASEKRARRRYYEVAFEAYLLMAAMCDEDPREAHKMAEKAITEEWVDKVLSETDFVTLYRFDSETERKAYRLAETLEVSPNRDAEIDKALRSWSQQLAQYAINFTDYAALKAFEDAGAELVKWISQHDDRVCNECHALDGQVFRIEEIPRKPHWGCRCFWRAVFREGKSSEMEAD